MIVSSFFAPERALRARISENPLSANFSSIPWMAKTSESRGWSPSAFDVVERCGFFSTMRNRTPKRCSSSASASRMPVRIPGSAAGTTTVKTARARRLWRRGAHGVRRTFRERRGLIAYLAILGPGMIAANAGNDAGGIATYATVGADHGYKLLWVLIPITISLGIIQEMCARMGAVTGKGLADLIRERFGVRWTAVFRPPATTTRPSARTAIPWPMRFARAAPSSSRVRTAVPRRTSAPSARRIRPLSITRCS